jgi:hypothetical protein
MPRLIDVEVQLVDLLDAIMVEQEAGREVPDEALTLAHEYTLEAADKRDACAAFVAFVERSEGDCDSEIKRLTARKRSIATARDRFMTYVQSIMETQGVRALMGTQFKFVLRESESVDAGPTELLPEEFVQTKVITEPDKIALKEALKRGESAGEARLVTKNSLQIKPLAVKDQPGSIISL